MDLPDFLTRSSDGNIVIPGRRIRLYDIVCDYNDGQSPEAIAEAYAPMPLATVYKVIGFYLDHKNEVDAHVREIQEEFDRYKATGRHLDMAKLQARMEALRANQHPAGA